MAETGFEVNSFPGAFVGCPKSLHSSQAKTQWKLPCWGEFLPKCTTTFGKSRGVASGTWIRALSSVSTAFGCLWWTKTTSILCRNFLEFFKSHLWFSLSWTSGSIWFQTNFGVSSSCFPMIPSTMAHWGGAAQKMPRRGDVTPWNLEGMKNPADYGKCNWCFLLILPFEIYAGRCQENSWIDFLQIKNSSGCHYVTGECLAASELLQLGRERSRVQIDSVFRSRNEACFDEEMSTCL